MTWVAVGVGGASLIGGIFGSSGASKAAQEQAQAEEQATAAQLQMFNQVQGNEQPYMQAGAGAQSQLNYLLGTGTPGQGGTAAGSSAGGFGSLNQPFTAQYMQQYSPAYQFQLQQGQQGVLNQDAGAQGAESGAALKDLTSFNQNYANTAFNSAFNQYQTQQQNTYGRLSGIAQLGQAAASNQATGASQFGSGIASTLGATGAAQAGGTVGATNAITGAIGNLGQLGWLGALSNPANQTANPNYSIQGADSSGLGYMVNS